MADANIKKIVIPKANLPAIIGKDFTYNLRYRIISEDKNRTSHWSRIYNIGAQNKFISDNLSYSWVKETANFYSGGTPGNKTITFVSGGTTSQAKMIVNDVSQLKVGMTWVSGTGLTTNNLITEINTTTKEITISSNFTVQATGSYVFTGFLTTKSSIRLNWEIPSNLGVTAFDIFVKRNSGSYSYYGTAYTNTYVVPRIGSETSITILVQMPTYPKAVTASAKLFETEALVVP